MPKRNLPEFYYDEKRQQYRKRITLPDGRKKDLYAKDKATLRRKVAELRRDIEEYGYDAENPTLAEYAIQWCARRLPGLSEARKSDYRNAINNHILPGLDGNKRLREISTADIDLFMASKANISSALHGKITSTLKQLFAAAVRDGKLRTSPAEHVRAGGKKAIEKTPLSEGQQAALIKAVEGTAAFPFVMLGFVCRSAERGDPGPPVGLCGPLRPGALSLRGAHLYPCVKLRRRHLHTQDQGGQAEDPAAAAPAPLPPVVAHPKPL